MFLAEAPSLRGVMADWATISSLATAGGTLVLAIATFGSVRSANRAARTAERALLAGLRPVLVPSRLQDPEQKFLWGDGRWTRLGGGQAGVELDGDVIYLSLPLRNVGTGIGVLQGWLPSVTELGTPHVQPEVGAFRLQQRDLYVPPGDIGFWQGAIRDRNDDLFDVIAEAIETRHMITVDLLYTDPEGGQRTISRFAAVPIAEDRWLASSSRHWRLDGPDPHPTSL